MKHLLGLVAVFVLAAVASAPVFAQENPALGTWKLNVEKSKFVGAPAPKELTRTLEADGDSVKYTFTGVGADGSALSYGFTVKYGAGEAPVTGSAPGGFDKIAIKKVSAHVYEATQYRDGKVNGGGKVVVSKDGKVTTVTLKGTTADGKASSTTSVYDKQ
ncbi:MAG TPA: hypothetical protein VGH83_08835 [Candidatus Acidoferrum sp.]|jgi:hypothetical protein